MIERCNYSFFLHFPVIQDPNRWIWAAIDLSPCTISLTLGSSCNLIGWRMHSCFKSSQLLIEAKDLTQLTVSWRMIPIETKIFWNQPQTLYITFAWIHIADLVAIFIFSVINCKAHVYNQSFLFIIKQKHSFSSQECFADEREIFETTSWSTYLRYVSTNRSLIYVLIFIAVVFVIEVNTNYFEVLL